LPGVVLVPGVFGLFSLLAFPVSGHAQEPGVMQIPSMSIFQTYWPISIAVAILLALGVWWYVKKRREARRVRRFEPGDSPVQALGGEAGDKPSLDAKQEKRLARNLGQLSMVEANLRSVKKDTKSIYITSCFNGEGKTTSAVNLAFGLAFNQGARVLLIDANPRSPMLHKLYGISLEPGLLDWLHNGNSADSVIHETKYPNLYVMPFGKADRGRPNLLKEDVLSPRLESLKEQFDFILVDGHSVLWSSDAPLLTSFFDGTLLVAECEHTKWDVAKEAAAKIGMLGGNVLGMVLNKRRFYIPRFLYGRI
jgi:capsular exopolysaccharide synthesis family protein